MIIAIDFDGTLVPHIYPETPKRVDPVAVETLHALQKAGHQLILLTMRDGDELDAAVELCRQAGITFWAVNNNPNQKSWTLSPKVYANIYIDDAALGCPVIWHQKSGRPRVSWTRVYNKLVERGVLPAKENA